MRSALLLAERNDLFDAVRDTLLAQGAVTSLDMTHVQIDSPHGRALLYELPGDDWRTPAPTATDDVLAPQMSVVRAVMIESRQPELVVNLVRTLSEQLPFDLWLLDSADIFWCPEQLDPTRITL